MIIVPPRGPDAYLYDLPIMVIGEAPGFNEAQERKPFVGKSGLEQESLFRRNDIDPKIFRYTNVIQEYTEGNPDPTSEQIAYWTPVLIQDILQFQPVLIVAVGAFATRWLLGSEATLEICHGIPHRPGCFDPSIRNRCPENCIVLPVYHPAAGFHDKTGDTRAVIGWDYSRVADTIRQIGTWGIESVTIREDSLAGHEIYRDVSGVELLDKINLLHPNVTTWGLDTEGVPGAPESIQISPSPGVGYTLRVTQPDFEFGVKAIQKYIVDAGHLLVVHQASSPIGCCYDFTLCLEMGLKLRYARIWDTMFAAYLLRLEPKGLKPLAWRWCGMRLTPYMDTIGEIGKLKQIDYLSQVSALKLPKPEPRIIFNHDGTVRSYKPSPLSTIAGKILKDIYSGKVNKDGEPTDPWERWKKTDKVLRREVESHLGPMPRGTLADIPLEEATRYSSMDPDASLRLGLSLMPEIHRLGLDHCMEVGMATLPIFWEMQQTGMPASREFFESLSADLHMKMDATQAKLSEKFFCSQPFNPKSPKDVQDLMRRRGLTGNKKTATGGYSTSEESIGHLQYTDPAIKLVFEWRGYQYDNDSYCADVLDRIPEDYPRDDSYSINCNIRPLNATRRLSSSDPNLLAMKPSIRFGYIWPKSKDRVFGAWDFSQIEMRVAAHLSQDPFLCSIFQYGRDVHSETAALINGIRLDETIDDLIIRYSVVPKEKRRAAKTVNFGILYGQSARGLWIQLMKEGITGYSVQSSGNLISRVYEVAYPVLKAYIDQTAIDAYETGGLVRDVWGMPRYLGGLFADTSTKEGQELKAASERQAFSHKVQGGARGMLLNAITYLGPIIQGLQESGLDIRWHLDYHDELIFSFPAGLWDMMNDIVPDAMINHCGIELLVPVLVEGHMGKSWGELK